MSQLESLKKARPLRGEAHRWIASYLSYLAPHENLMGNGSHAALRTPPSVAKRTILVFSDARTENHQEPGIVEYALHSPNPH